MRIIAVDDDPFIIEVLPRICAKLGFTDIDTTMSAAQALSMAAAAGPRCGCFLLDINMPEMDGIELCRKIRAMPAHRRTPIIMLSGMVERGFVDRAFEAGATDCATKPFDLVELGARLRAAKSLNEAWDTAVFADPVEDPEIDERVDWASYRSPLEVGGNGRFLDPVAACNYLTQLSRMGLGGIQVIGAKLDGAEAICAKAGRSGFLNVLSEVGDALDDAFRRAGYVMTYLGRGNFVIVSKQARPMAPNRLEADVQDILDERMAEHADGTPFDLEVSVGIPIRPILAEMGDVNQVFERAVTRAEQRFSSKQKSTSRLNFFARRF